MLIYGSCETPEPISDYLYFKLRSLFLHSSVYWRWCFCVGRSLYSLRAKNGHLDIRERIDQPPFPQHSSFWKCSLSVECFRFKGVKCALSSRHQLYKNKPNINNWNLSIYCKSFRGISRRVCFYLFAMI